MTKEQVEAGVARARAMHTRWPEDAGVQIIVALAAERDEAVALASRLRELFPPVHPDVERHEDDDVCGKCGALVLVADGLEAEPGDPCWLCAADAYVEARALLDTAGADCA